MYKYYLALFLIVIFFSFELSADTTETFIQKLSEQNTLTGNWGGLRNRLLKRGLQLEAIYTCDLFSNVSGGLERGTEYLDNVDLILLMNADKLLGWNGVHFFLYGLGNHGRDPSIHTGDVQIISNISAFSTWKLYEAWIQKNFFDYRLSFLTGLYDLNSEFAELESSKIFLNSSHGIGIDFSQSGKNGPSVFPDTTVGLRVKWSPFSRFTLKSAVINGIAGDPGNRHGTQFTFRKDGGVLSVTEAAFLIKKKEHQTLEIGRKRHRRIGRLKIPEYKGKFALGGWYYTAKFDTIQAKIITGEPDEQRGNYGLYFLAEYEVFHERDTKQCLSFFTRLGVAYAKINRFGSFTGGGMAYIGLIPGRDKDEMGIAFAGAHNGSEFKRAQERRGNTVDDSEWNIELTYHAEITPWLVIQPDIQYIINPDTDPGRKNALAIGLRFEVSF